MIGQFRSKSEQSRLLGRPSLAVLGTVVAIFFLITLVERVTEGWVAHGLGHLVVAALLALLLFVALRAWPPPRTTPPGRTARRVVVIGLSGVVGGQLLEVLGARVDEPGALMLESWAHPAGQVVTMLALITLLMGTVLSLIAAARDKAVSWWLVGLAALTLVGLLTIVMGGVPPM